MAERIAIPYDKVLKDETISKVITKKASEVRPDRIVLEDGSEVPFAYAVIAIGKQWTAPLE